MSVPNLNPTPPLLLSCFERTAKWMRRGGRENDVVLSSRVRLARNLRRYEFPHHASAEELLTVRHRAFTALHTIGEGEVYANLRLLPFEEFTGWERQSLVDRHLSSREHITEEMGRGVAALARCFFVHSDQRRRPYSLARLVAGPANLMPPMPSWTKWTMPWRAISTGAAALPIPIRSAT